MSTLLGDLPRLGLYAQAIPDLLKTGLPNTLILTVCASVIGSLLGMLLAVAGISRTRWLRWPARIYTDIFRGLPEVVDHPADRPRRRRRWAWTVWGPQPVPAGHRSRWG